MTEKQIKLVEDNIKLVNYFIYQFYPYLIGDEDMYQEACTGLIRAAKTYDEEKGSFSKHVGWQIRATISKHFQTMNTQSRNNGLDEYHLDKEAYEGSSYKDLLSEESHEEAIVVSDLLTRAFSVLSDREREFVEDYYIREQTYQQVADNHGVTNQRCQQIVRRGVSKMQKEVMKGGM